VRPLNLSPLLHSPSFTVFLQITDFIYFRVTRYTVFDTDFFDMESWEATLWFFCTLINVCALVMSWVYTFDILQQETEALAAQEQVGVGVARGALTTGGQALAAA
jgi:hypothetical protein